MSDPGRLPARERLRIIGLGNELLSDDGAGIRAVRELRERLRFSDAVFEELSVGGLNLLDHIIGCELCVIVDSVVTGTHPPGTSYRCVLAAASEPCTLASSHQIDLGQVLSLASLLGADVPQKLIVYAIEAADVTTFGDHCTIEVSRGVQSLVEAICRDVEDYDRVLPASAGQWHLLSEAVQD